MSTTDPIVNLARQRIITISAQLEVELSEKNHGGPTIEILRRLRERAAESLAALIEINFNNPAEIAKAVTLQNEVKRYDEWVGWLREIISEGRTYDAAMKEEEREELLDHLSQSEEGRQEAIALGLIEDLPRD